MKPETEEHDPAEQCRYVFYITLKRCAPCGGYDRTCRCYTPKGEKSDEHLLYAAAQECTGTEGR